MLLVLGLALTVCACTVNPVTGTRQLDLMGEPQEIQLGASLYPQYTAQSYGEVQDAELQVFVDRVGDRLASVGHRPQLPWTFNAVNDPSVNAYALPGGKVSITRGLLARMESEDELAAVLGHETGHVTARHASQQYTRQVLSQLALVGAAVYMQVEDVDNRGLYMIGGMVGAQLALAHYSREQERQSDFLGFEYMSQLGYNPVGMIELMDTLGSTRQRAPSFVEQMFATHPLTSERIDTARQRVANAPPELTSRAMTTAEYTAATGLVRRQREAYDRVVEASALMSKESFGEARRLLQQSSDEWQDDGLLRIFLATVVARQENMDAATREASRAVVDAPGIFMVQATGARIFLARERWEPALDALDRADRILPEMPDVRYSRGRCLEELGREREAAEAYLWVARNAPDSDVGRAAADRYRRLTG
jgi:predicted Zn-dependent protease